MAICLIGSRGIYKLKPGMESAWWNALWLLWSSSDCNSHRFLVSKAALFHYTPTVMLPRWELILVLFFPKPHAYGKTFQTCSCRPTVLRHLSFSVLCYDLCRLPILKESSNDAQLHLTTTIFEGMQPFTNLNSNVCPFTLKFYVEYN